MGTLLGELRDGLRGRDGRLHGSDGELGSPHSKDWEDAGVEREGDEGLEGLGQAGQEETRRIRAALQRMGEGEYGYCVQCGTEVAEDRLNLLPATPFCAPCAAKHG